MNIFDRSIEGGCGSARWYPKLVTVRRSLSFFLSVYFLLFIVQLKHAHVNPTTFASELAIEERPFWTSHETSITHGPCQSPILAIRLKRFQSSGLATTPRCHSRAILITLAGLIDCSHLPMQSLTRYDSSKAASYPAVIQLKERRFLTAPSSRSAPHLYRSIRILSAPQLFLCPMKCFNTAAFGSAVPNSFQNLIGLLRGWLPNKRIATPAASLIYTFYSAL